MKKSALIKNWLKKNWLLISVVIISIVTLIFFPQTEIKALKFTGNNILNFLIILPPVFICIGLLDVWIDRKTMIKIMGEKSGIKGALLAIAFGMITAVPIYALFPIIGVLLKKGCKLSNVLLFLCASEDIRIPLLLFEISSFGWQFTFLRFGLNAIAVIVFSFAVEKLLPQKDIMTIYENAEIHDNTIIH